MHFVIHAVETLRDQCLYCVESASTIRKVDRTGLLFYVSLFELMPFSRYAN